VPHPPTSSIHEYPSRAANRASKKLSETTRPAGTVQRGDQMALGRLDRSAATHSSVFCATLGSVKEARTRNVGLARTPLKALHVRRAVLHWDGER
jgi:hypothetical protein